MVKLKCKKCSLLLDASNFKKDVRYKSGHTSWCYGCHKQANKEWYLKNKERQNSKAIAWQKNNPEKAKQSRRKYHSNNLEKRRKQRSDWGKENKDKIRAIAARRKARKLDATPKWANKIEISNIYTLAHDIQERTGVPHHVDHIIPLQGKTVCGLHCEENLRVITAEENVRKKNKLLPDLFVPAPSKPITPVNLDLLDGDAA